MSGRPTRGRTAPTSPAAPLLRLQETDLAYSLLLAAKAMTAVLHHGRSLDQALTQNLGNEQSFAVRGAVRDLATNGIRQWGRAQVLVQILTQKPGLNPPLLETTLGLGLGLLWPSDAPKYPSHTVVNQLVNACAAEPTLVAGKGLVNACLRNFLRDTPHWVNQALKNPQARWSLPGWWVRKVMDQHPIQGEALLNQAAQHPPMVLRVNSRIGTAQQYVDYLAENGMTGRVIGPQAVLLAQPCPVDALPGFSQGEVSVQDSAAQLAAPLLDLQNGQRVLDACAAPGGKTGHLLELANIDLLALDSSESRLNRVADNVERIAPTLDGDWRFNMTAAKAEALNDWWDGTPFDAILADVPCTGSGVVRRHPDIPWLRRPDDSANLSRIQHTILDALWSTLKPNGTLLLVTCSIFREEGPLLTKAFTDKHPDATPLDAPGVVYPLADAATSPDGFFYAKFRKRAHS
ncbi:16S rRNA (cytosine(967)-C(5))-methyltransferase RsmB [Limnobacter humi]|uniref:16S rRNA (Cytosine(967)-C(5))-methyltransferase RsmB n=1 Tax=Limnobacter humi TaxID=1778671 RepID=A0ABT1WDI8_9BURK|nr:16S rRNA (cytosine(967)-C(5))-methyltransferase RsmB [Limnobacter humi]